jgi:hypothetical protein
MTNFEDLDAEEHLKAAEHEINSLPSAADRGRAKIDLHLAYVQRETARTLMNAAEAMQHASRRFQQ